MQTLKQKKLDETELALDAPVMLAYPRVDRDVDVLLETGGGSVRAVALDLHDSQALESGLLTSVRIVQRL